MATPVTFNGVAYSVPAFGDVGYAQGPGNLSSYLIVLASGTLQASGGLFSLTAQANFGPNFGLTAVNFTSTTANPATAGSIRLAKTDTIDWRNNANTLNLPLGINGSDQLTFNGVILATAASASGIVSTGTAGRVTVYPATGTTVDDVYVQNAFNIDILIAPQAARSVALEYTIPNPGNAVAAATFSLLELAQTFTAVKTFSGGAGAITMSASTIAMGTNKITGLASGTVAADALAWGQAFTAGNITFSPTTAGIVGTTTNDAAAAGNVGQYIEALTGSGTSFPATGINGEGASISLTAGDWDLSGLIYANVQGITTTVVTIGISTTVGNSTTGLVLGSNYFVLALPVASASQQIGGCISGYRQSLASTTTIYFKILATYTGVTPTYGCRLSARRVR